jgi:hypothetical protein
MTWAFVGVYAFAWMEYADGVEFVYRNSEFVHCGHDTTFNLASSEGFVQSMRLIVLALPFNAMGNLYVHCRFHPWCHANHVPQILQASYISCQSVVNE